MAKRDVSSSSTDLPPALSLTRDGSGPNVADGCNSSSSEDILGNGNYNGRGDDDGPKRKRIKATKVDHTYRDFSQTPLEEVGAQLARNHAEIHSAATSAELPVVARSNKNGGFPRKLYEMVTNPDYQHIIRFMPHGRSWAVLDKEALASEVLPKYFNHSRFESFNRQVNGWGFKRLLKSGPDHKSYYHECFLRGRPELTSLMVRLVNPGKRIPDRDREPDFYEISSKAPLPEIAMPPNAVSSFAFGAASSSRKNQISEKGEGGGLMLPCLEGGTFTMPPPTPRLTQSQLLHQVVNSPQAQANPAEALRLYQEYTRASTFGIPSSCQAQSLTAVTPQSQLCNSTLPVQSASALNLASPDVLAQSYPNLSNASFPVHPAQALAQDNHVADVPSSSDCLKNNALPSNLYMNRVPSYLLEDKMSDNSSFSEGKMAGQSMLDNDNGILLSTYNIEPDPLLEGAPLKIRENCDQDEMLSHIDHGAQEPLLKAFAEIYFSSTNYQPYI